MALVILSDGDDITAENIEANWEACRTVINEQRTTTIRRKVFGPQHLPSLLNSPGIGGTLYPHARLFASAETLVSSAFTGVSYADIRTDWQPMLNLNGGGSGYKIGGCIMLAWASGTVRRFATATADAQAHFALTAKIDGGDEAPISAADMGFVINDPCVYGKAVLADYQYQGIPFLIWTLYDRSTLLGTWTLNELRLRAAKDAASWYMGDMELGFLCIDQADGTVE